MDAAELRTGGLPLLNAEQDWPECPRCDAPMLFRAQMPLAMTALVAPTDERMVLVFECHSHREHERCDSGVVLVAQAGALPREAPIPRSFDVVVDDSTAEPAAILALARTLVDEEDAVEHEHVRVPGPVLFAQPRSIAEQAKHVLEGAGAHVQLRPSAPTQLSSVYGGILVPFDDGGAGLAKTTLPPLGAVSKSVGNRRMRGLIAGATPGNRDIQLACTCGRPTRTIMRLLGSAKDESEQVSLGPAIAQVCLSCSTGSLHRSTAA